MATCTTRCSAWCAAKGLESGYQVCQLAAAMDHPTEPPAIPQITDEARDTPVWVPMLGVALGVAFVAWLLLS